MDRVRHGLQDEAENPHEQRPVPVLELHLSPGAGEVGSPTRPVPAQGVDEDGTGDSGGPADREAAGTAAGAQDETAVLRKEPGGVAPFQAGAARGGQPEGGLGDRRMPPS